MSMISRLVRITRKTGKFWIEAYALYLATIDKRVPLYARVAAGVFALYILSPFDIVPDPIPVIGIVDDFIVIPLGFLFIRFLIPEYLRLEHREMAAMRQPERPGFSEAIGLVVDTIRRIPMPVNIRASEIPRKTWMRLGS
jgi:uncharacterized membrane protein YkvA (DUF1232 family)